MYQSKTTSDKLFAQTNVTFRHDVLVLWNVIRGVFSYLHDTKKKIRSKISSPKYTFVLCLVNMLFENISSSLGRSE